MSYDSRWTGPLSVRHDAIMGMQVLAFDGALDAATVGHAREALDAARHREAPLVLDLRWLARIDGQGTALLSAALRRLREDGRPVAVAAPERAEAADAVGWVVPDAVPIAGTLSDAIKAVAPRWTPERPRWTPEPSVPIRTR